MTISTEDRKAGPFTGNGVTTAFPFDFKVFLTSDLEVIKTVNEVETILTLTTHYSVTLNADQDVTPGGTVTLITIPESGSLITITTDVPYTQSVKLSNAGYFPSVINEALDKLTILCQQLKVGVDRAIKLEISSFSSAADFVAQIVAAADSAEDANLAAAQAAASAASVDLHVIDVQRQTKTAWLTTGTSPSFLVTTAATADYGAYTAGERLRVKFHAAGSSTTNTINRDSRGAKLIKQYDATGKKIDAVIFINQLLDLEYDGTDYIALNRAPLPLSGEARQTVLTGHSSSTGIPDILPNTSVNLNLTSTNINSNSPLVVSAAQGYNSSGSRNLIGVTMANLSWTGLTAAQTNFLFVDVGTDGVLTADFTILPPIYQFGGTVSNTNLQNTFDIENMKMFVGNGTTNTQINRVFIGEAVTDATTVTSTIVYAYKGKYMGVYSSPLPAPNVRTTKDHKIGILPGVNCFFEMECIVAEHGYGVGDILMNVGIYDVTGPYTMTMSFSKLRNNVSFTTGNNGLFVVAKGGGGGLLFPTLANWKYRLIVNRTW